MGASSRLGLKWIGRRGSARPAAVWQPDWRSGRTPAEPCPPAGPLSSVGKTLAINRHDRVCRRHPRADARFRRLMKKD